MASIGPILIVWIFIVAGILGFLYTLAAAAWPDTLVKKGPFSGS